MRFLYASLVGVVWIIVCVIIIFFFDLRHDQAHIPKGIQISGTIEVGGMTYEDAFNKVDALLARTYTDTRTVITDQNSTWQKTLVFSELKPTIVREEFIQQLHVFENQKNIVQRFWTWIQMWLGKRYSIDPIIHWQEGIAPLLETTIAEAKKSVGEGKELLSTSQSLQYSLEQSLWVTNPSRLVIAFDRGLDATAQFSLPEKIFVTSKEEHAYASVLTHDQLYALLLPGENTGEWFVNITLLGKMLPPQEARDAQFDTTDPRQVRIIPSRIGIALDYITISNAMIQGLIEGRSTVHASYTNLVLSTFSTQQAEELGIEHMVSSFTTYYSAGATRTHNIQLIADLVDGAIVMPGAQFNLNAYVGKRTASKGFKKAGMIFNGELVDDFGGGVSQFATTLYNAVFWGGYKDIQHKAHSWYFSRYPEGIEATVSWPDVDLIFENDYSSALLIDTSYTKNSITVSFYGNNDGRIFTGEHVGGKTTTQILEPGGAMARSVEGSISTRTDFKEPGIKYLLDTGKKEFSSPAEHGGGTKGWTVKVVRTITRTTEGEDGTIITIKEKKSWPVVYQPEPYVIYVHSCILVGATSEVIVPLQNCAPPTIRD